MSLTRFTDRSGGDVVADVFMFLEDALTRNIRLYHRLPQRRGTTGLDKCGESQEPILAKSASSHQVSDKTIAGRGGGQTKTKCVVLG
jgi:hypothetical protein